MKKKQQHEVCSSLDIESVFFKYLKSHLRWSVIKSIIITIAVGPFIRFWFWHFHCFSDILFNLAFFIIHLWSNGQQVMLSVPSYKQQQDKNELLAVNVLSTKESGVSLRMGHRVNWTAVRMSLVTWFDHLKRNSVQYVLPACIYQLPSLWKWSQHPCKVHTFIYL